MKNKIKKIAGGLAITCICLLGSGCDSPEETDTSYSHYKTIEIDGHKFIIRKSGSVGGICHHPDCQCGK